MPLQTLPCRAFQRGFALGARLLPWRTPTVLSGAGSLLKLPDVFSREGASRPLVVASRRQCADERFLALRAALDDGRGFRLHRAVALGADGLLAVNGAAARSRSLSPFPPPPEPAQRPPSPPSSPERSTVNTPSATSA